MVNSETRNAKSPAVQQQRGIRSVDFINVTCNARCGGQPSDDEATKNEFPNFIRIPLRFAFNFALLFFCLLFASTVKAQQANQTLEHCAAKTRGTLELNECVGKEYERADSQLNCTYRLLLSKFNQNRRKALQNEQREWIKKRDRICEAEAAEWNGGTGETAARVSCLAEQTKVTMNELGALIKAKKRTVQNSCFNTPNLC